MLLKRLDGKVAVVTGATKAMGKAIADRLADEGAAVVGTGRSAELGENVAGAIRDRGGRACFVAGDLGDAATAREVISAALGQFGRVDVVVNNAAPSDVIRGGGEAAVADEPFDVFDRMMKVNVYGPFLLAQQAIPLMVAAGGGAFVSISSVTTIRHPLQLPGHVASKAALEALTRSIAVDYGAAGIRANSILVGSIRNPETAHVVDDPVRGQAARDNRMLAGPGLPEDVAAMVAFLASDESKFVTAVSIPLDGGAAAKYPAPPLNELYGSADAAGQDLRTLEARA